MLCQESEQHFHRRLGGLVVKIQINNFVREHVQLRSGDFSPEVVWLWRIVDIRGLNVAAPVKSERVGQNEAGELAAGVYEVLRNRAAIKIVGGRQNVCPHCGLLVGKNEWRQEWMPLRNPGKQELVRKPTVEAVSFEPTVRTSQIGEAQSGCDRQQVVPEQKQKLPVPCPIQSRPECLSTASEFLFAVKATGNQFVVARSQFRVASMERKLIGKGHIPEDEQGNKKRKNGSENRAGSFFCPAARNDPKRNEQLRDRTEE